MRAKFVMRVRIILAFFVLFTIVLSIKLYFVQVVQGEDYREAAQNQYIASSSPLENRGKIIFVDKDGLEHSAAIMNSGYRLVVHVRKV